MGLTKFKVIVGVVAALCVVGIVALAFKGRTAEQALAAAAERAAENAKLQAELQVSKAEQARLQGWIDRFTNAPRPESGRTKYKPGDLVALSRDTTQIGTVVTCHYTVQIYGKPPVSDCRYVLYDVLLNDGKLLQEFENQWLPASISK